jgi:alanine dehydrogenase
MRAQSCSIAICSKIGGSRSQDEPPGFIFGLMPTTLVLTRSDVAALLDYESCITAVEDAFRAFAAGDVLAPGAIGTHVSGGGFHVKTAGLKSPRGFYATKTNGNFPENPVTTGLPTIQGVISLHDANDGRLLAVMDSMEITTIRTSAASAVAAKYLSREDSRSALIIGCGNQGRSHLRALLRVRGMDRVTAFDMNPALAERFAKEMTAETGIQVAACSDFRTESGQADIVVTTTPSKNAFLHAADVSPSTFVAAVGADSETKHEIAPDLLRLSTVVVDILEQSAAFGDLHHAIDAGIMTRDDVYADLGTIVSGAKPGRRSREEIIVFDSTGTAIQDVAAAALVYERASAAGRGLTIDLGS